MTPDPKGRPSFQHRVQARSHPEIVAAIEDAAVRLGRTRAVTFRGRKISAEAIINALLMNALALPEAELDRAIAVTGPGGVALPWPEPSPPDEPGRAEG